MNQGIDGNFVLRVRVMVFKATFNNISVISWWSVFYWWMKPEYPEKIIDLSLVQFCL